MLTKKQLKIFEPLIRDIYREYPINEIKKIANESSNNAISIALKRFKEENLVNEKRIGKSLLYSANIENELFFCYLLLINFSKLSKIAIDSIRKIKEEIEKHAFFYSMVIFGSHAIEKQTAKSDLDIAVFIEKEENRKKIESAIKAAELKILLKIDAHVITQKEFLEMLKEDYENLGKQIARKHLLIHNPAIFYSLLKEGIKNGFKL